MKHIYRITYKERGGDGTFQQICDIFQNAGIIDKFKEEYDIIKTDQYIGRNDINGTKLFCGDCVKVVVPHEDIEAKGIICFDSSSFYVKSDVLSMYRWMDYEVELLV